MRCPRCHSQLPDAAPRCPDCKLPKPKASPEQNAAQHKKKQAKRRNSRNSNRPKWVNILAGIVVLLLTSGIGVYLFLFFAGQPQELDPHLAQPALANLRQAPSSQS